MNISDEILESFDKLIPIISNDKNIVTSIAIPILYPICKKIYKKIFSSNEITWKIVHEKENGVNPNTIYGYLNYLLKEYFKQNKKYELICDAYDYDKKKFNDIIIISDKLDLQFPGCNVKCKVSNSEQYGMLYFNTYQDMEITKTWLVESFNKYKKEKTKSKYVRICTYTQDNGWDDTQMNIVKNFTNTIITKENQDLIISRVDYFKQNKLLYHKLGQSYKLVFCFEGPPGTGKSSTVYAMGDRWQMPVYMFNKENIKDKLEENIKSSDPNSILFFDDIDTYLHDMKNNKIIDGSKNSVVLQEDISKDDIINTLLKVLDGYIYISKQIVVITTNKIHLLDERLLRKGRIDYTIKFDYCNMDQLDRLSQLYSKSFSLEKKKELVGKITPADFVFKYCM